MKNFSQHVVLMMALAVGACSAGAPTETATSEAAVLTQICTPNDETCDFGCFFDGGPSTDDCIIRCNATGTAWQTLQNCGWAQNGLTSASCLDKEPHPVCENN
jgi:hypothetical protein